MLVFLSPVFVLCRCTQIGNNDHEVLDNGQLDAHLLYFTVCLL